MIYRKCSLPPRFLSLSLLTVLATAGCGGGKAGSTTGAGGTSVRVSASPTAIAYGGNTKITWSTSKTLGFRDSNFGLDSDSYKSGSLTDTPGTTTTYTLKVSDQSYNDLSDEATVTVAPIAKSVLVVGDASKAGPTQIQSFVRTLTTGTVGVAATVPDPSDAYGVLVISPTLVYSTDAKTQVKKWLDAGKGVVLCGESPRVLATGDTRDDDVAAIGSWFFGVDTLGGSNYPSVRSSSSGLVNLSVTIRGVDAYTGDVTCEIRGYGPQVDAVANGDLCAYLVPTGGRLLYSSSPVGYGNQPGKAYQQAFESSFRWVGQ